PVSRRMPDTIARMWRTASTMLPEPASPFVRIIAAPSPIRRSASPRSRQPHTNGTRKPNLSMWKCSSAGVRTSDSSMKSMPSASRICASTKCPMRAFAMTGMVTAFWISWILRTGDMRATPPSLRMSDGTRSSAITDAAPASSAIFACSALVTSMMTPPLSISASPMCLRSAILSPFASAMRAPFIFAVGAPSQGANYHFTARLGRLHSGLPRARRAAARTAIRPAARTAARRSGVEYARSISSYQRCGDSLGGMPRGPLASRAYRGPHPSPSLADLARRHRRKRQPERPLAAAVDPKRRPRSVGHATLERARKQRAGVQTSGQRHQQRKATFRLGPRDVLGHPPLQRRDERIAAPPILPRDTRHVAVEQSPLTEAVDGGLQKRARVQIGQLLGGAEPLGQRRGRHEPAEAQARKQHFRERTDVDDDAIPIQRLQRGGRPLAVVQAAVEAVFDDGHLVSRRDRQQPRRDVAAD